MMHQHTLPPNQSTPNGFICGRALTTRAARCPMEERLGAVVAPALGEHLGQSRFGAAAFPPENMTAPLLRQCAVPLDAVRIVTEPRAIERNVVAPLRLPESLEVLATEGRGTAESPCDSEVRQLLRDTQLKPHGESRAVVLVIRATDEAQSW
jgi:hypothetical protein